MSKLSSFLRVTSAWWGARTKMQQFRTRAELEHWQDLRVQQHLRDVIGNSAYYRELYQGREPADWRSFPITDKHAMMENFDRFNTIGVGRQDAMEVARKANQTRDFKPTLRGATVGLSSGTSGVSSLFLSSPNENCTFVGTALARLIRASLLARHRIAFFHRANSNLYRSLNSGRIRYQFFDLSNELELQLTQLTDFSPTLIIGPPFVLRRLGEAKRNGRLRIAPTGLLSVAEVLDDADHAAIESDFGVPLDQAYIATEGFIAATCRLGSLHVNEDLLVMQREWIDEEQGRFVPIITDFRRYAQPIIRYRLDDVLVESKKTCECGSVFSVLERIEGRCDDVLVFRRNSGQGIRRVFPDFIRRTMALATTDIKDYRVIQESLSKLTVQLNVVAELQFDAETEIKFSLTKLLERFECEPPEFVFETAVSSDPQKKRRRVSREFVVEFNQ